MRETSFLCDSRVRLEIGVRFSVYGLIVWTRARARSCLGSGLVVISKVGASGPAFGVRQVLRTRLASSAIKVAKLCAGVPSLRQWVADLACADADRWAGATGSRVALACCSVSAKVNSRQASRRCHST